mmetsp:Transcript_68424/g.164269  ORF Transcript_68424/g.164269 Transcript_68424/m.164269 type:complete len:644 (-) Transcript_68424:64-1995(-)|eukprot:CAMPEP_0178402202 /NCGR_PEP_ID=MMETSP0689_2-20121128/16712_1 /TAXON_ID=160604 /ORGANISM="Amphidinium massartii, Strain CS-259" /LENGTH=643 /DNA_ID=CAMNT_0020023079 /DNA_START=204 /DNA_END=2135 /DNA_ORIENTATION=+
MQFEIEVVSAIFGALAFIAFRWLSLSLNWFEGKRGSSKLSKADICIDLAAGEVCVKQAKEFNEDFGSDPEPEADGITEFTESEPEEELLPEPVSENYEELAAEELLEPKSYTRSQTLLRSAGVCFLSIVVIVLTLILGGLRLPEDVPQLSQSASVEMANAEVVASAAVCDAQDADNETSALPDTNNATASTMSSGKAFPIKLERQKMHMYTAGENSYYRSAYYGTVNVGSPAVPFTVVFDTGSGHLVLPSMYCHTATCRAHRRYRRSDSRTATDIDYDGTPVLAGKPRDQITVSFGTGQVTGVFVEDVVCLDSGIEPKRVEEESEAPETVETDDALVVGGPESRLGCMKLRMIAATDMSEDPFREFQFDGVLGLGLQGLSQTEEFNFVEVAAASWGGLNPHVFAVFLAVDEDEESEITFGGWDDARRREAITWNDVDDPDQGHWTVRVKSIRVDGEEVAFCESGCKAVVDTGTSLLSVPSAVFPELYEMLKHPAPLSGLCAGMGPQLHIELEGTTITLGPEDYARTERSSARKPRPRLRAGSAGVLASGSQVYQMNATSPWTSTRRDLWCKPTLMTLDLPEPLGPKLFILGEPVLRKYYTVYDAKEKRVGFGRARHRKGRDSLPRVPKSMFDMFRMQRGLRAS